MFNAKKAFEKFNTFKINKLNPSRDNAFWYDLVNSFENKDLDGLVKALVYIIQHMPDGVPHPKRPTVLTYPAFSSMASDGWANAILFCDVEGLNQWILIQQYSLIDCVVYDGCIYRVDGHERVLEDFNRSQVNKCVSLLIDSSADKAALHVKSVEICISHPRPFHFFYDQFFSLYFYSTKINFNEINCKFSEGFNFYPLQSIGLKANCVDKAVVKLLPLISPGLWRKDPELRSKLSEYELIIKNYALNNFSNRDFLYSNDGAVLWIGITGQKRSWVEQVDGYINIIDILKREYKLDKVYIDGFTSRYGYSKDVPEDNTIANYIKLHAEQLGVECEILVGKDYVEKIFLASKCDLFIANSGSGALVPLCFIKGKGVLHGLIDTFPQHHKKNKNVNLLKGQPVSNNIQTYKSEKSYTLDWQKIVDGLDLFENDFKANSSKLKSSISGWSDNRKAVAVQILRSKIYDPESYADILNVEINDLKYLLDKWVFYTDLLDKFDRVSKELNVTQVELAKLYVDFKRGF